MKKSSGGSDSINSNQLRRRQSVAKADGMHPRQNRVLGALSEREFKRLTPHLQLVPLERNDSAYEPNRAITHVYFPLNGIISVVTVMEDGTELEAATVGNEGCVGIPVFLGSNKSSTKAFCQVPGMSVRIKREHFCRQAASSEEFRNILRRYTEALLVQLAQTAACNAVHRVEQRCARWLLQTHDRMRGDHFTLTQEFLGGMLGVRRAGVSEACSRLQEQQLIRYTRGVVEIIDREGLERASCECYRATQKEFDRLLGPTSKRRTH